ncbi:MAG: AAA family ATPase [Clostridia bacterium]|nr:AAA family ATPase [Clostridia bacterium]
MAKTKLFDSYTFKRKLPEPFNDSSISQHSSDESHFSRYNTVSTKKSTLHAPALCGIMAYMALEMAAGGNEAKGAIGSQGEMIVAEYPSRKGETHVTVFNKTTGKFTSGRFTSPTDAPQTYTLKADKESGSAMFFALMPKALEDDEFSTEYAKLMECAGDGYSNLEEAVGPAFILCDNLYRRVENSDSLGQSGIKTNIPGTGNLQNFTALNLNKGTYSPTSTLFGDFEVLKPGMAPGVPVMTTAHADLIGKYPLSDRQLSAADLAMVPKLEDWYIVPSEVVRICQHAKLTTAGTQPMRNFMLRGPAGTGKTEAAKAIAAGMNLPYTYITCSANSEIYELLGQILPDLDGKPVLNGDAELPTFDDIRMDPPTAYEKLTGEYREDATEEAVYGTLLEVMQAQAEKSNDTDAPKPQGQKFKYVDTPLVQALRYGYCIELQEPSIIANPGVLVGLNALLDRCNAVTLPTGEIVSRHPDCVIIVTTNNDYAGCKDINQSVISRMNLVMDIEQPDADTMVERVCGITGCKDLAAVKRMAEMVEEISQRCRETMITDGSCGMRELIAWVQSFMICEDELEAARYTVLSSVSADPENRAEIYNTCLAPKYAA